VWLQNVDNSTNEVRLPFYVFHFYFGLVESERIRFVSGRVQSFAHLFTLTNKIQGLWQDAGEKGKKEAEV